MTGLDHIRIALLSTACLVPYACINNSEADFACNPITEVLTIETTKVTLSDDLRTAWEDGDKIAVWTGTSEAKGEFQTCSVSSNSITVLFPDESSHRYNYAVRYCGEALPSYSAGALRINLPAEYDYTEVCGINNPVPMVAKNLYTEGTVLVFRSVGALLRLSASGIPATADKLVVTFDKDVTGTFEVSGPDSQEPFISVSNPSGNNVVTINLTPYTDYSEAVINIPLPCGTISVSSVVAKTNGAVSGSVDSPLYNWTATRTRGRKATAAFTPSMASMILAPGNLYTNGGNFAISDNCYDHVYNADRPGDFSLSDEALYSCADRTHFNCNELYYLMRSRGLASLPSIIDANSNYNNPSSYETLAKCDFGDGCGWRVPSQADWHSLFSDNPSRPGAKLLLSIGGNAAVEQEHCCFLRATVYDFSGELGNGAEGKFCGIILFPDNVCIPASFSELSVEDINKTSNASGTPSNTAFTRTKISKERLDELVSAGCAFLPAAGMVNNGAFSNANLVCNYLSSTQLSASNDTRLRAQRNTIGYEVSTAKTTPWCSVRLVRDSGGYVPDLPGDEGGTAANVRIGTYNLRISDASDEAAGNGWSVRKEKINRSIRENGFDVFGFQECSPQMQTDLPAMLGDIYTFVFFSPYSQNGTGKSANGIAYKANLFDISDYRYFWLSETPDIMVANDEGRNRGGCCAVFTHKNTGVRFFLMETHAPLEKNANNALAHIYIDLEQLYNPDGLPSILVGDMNNYSTSDAAALLRTWWQDSYFALSGGGNISGPWGTFNGFDIERDMQSAGRIDYVYFRGKAAPLSYVCNDSKYDGRYASDHLPVFCDFSIFSLD